MTANVQNLSAVTIQCFLICRSHFVRRLSLLRTSLKAENIKVQQFRAAAFCPFDGFLFRLESTQNKGAPMHSFFCQWVQCQAVGGSFSIQRGDPVECDRPAVAVYRRFSRTASNKESSSSRWHPCLCVTASSPFLKMTFLLQLFSSNSCTFF